MYGGTKAEMERLLEDAEAILAKQGVVRDFSIDSFADIVEAIHAVQVEYGASGYSIDELSQKLQEKSLTEQELHRISQDLYASRSQQYQDEQDAYNQVVEAYQNGSLSIQDALILTGTTSYEAKETVEGSLNALQGAWDNFLVSLGDDDTDVGDTTDKLVDAACNAIEKIVPRVGTILGKLAVVVAEKGPEALRRLKEAFLNSLPPEWREKIENFGKNVDEFIKKLGPLKDWLEENIPKAMKFLGDVFDSFTDEDGAGKKFLDFLDGLVNVITTVGGVFNAIGTTIGTCLADLVSGFEGTENVGGTVFYNIGEFFRKCGEVFADVKDTIDRVISDVTGFFEGLETGVDETISNVIDFFKNLPQNILDALGNVGDLLWGAGESIMNGFWDGLESVWDNLTGWIDDIGGWIADNKGPKEYDLKLLVPNGKWIMQGLEKGLRSNMGLIDDALDDITDRMSMDMTLSSTSSASPVVSARSTGPQIIIQEMNVREEQDIYKVANMLDVIWNAEIAGSLV